MEARLADAKGKCTSGEAFKVAPADAVSFWMEVPTVTYAECLLHQASSEAEFQRATGFIGEALEAAGSRGSVRQVIILSLLRAMALESLGESDAGLALLASTVELARPLGLIRTFLDRGPGLYRLLENLACQQPDDVYVRELVAARSGPTTNPVEELDRFAALELLSARELDVLHLMVELKSNKEIGASLYISYETVKNHAKSIYRKLGVRNRREAVARAVALGLDTHK